MNDERRHDEELTPAERRLAGLLGLVRAQPAPGDPELTRSVMRTVRWQVLVRGALGAIGSVGATVGEGLSLLLRGGAGRRR